MSTDALILAAGKGERMRSETPKILHKILGKTVIERVLSNVRKTKVERIFVMVGPDSEPVRNAIGADVQYLVQKEPKGTGDALRVFLEESKTLSEFVLVVNGDNPLISTESMSAMLSAARVMDASAIFLTSILAEPGELGRVARDSQGNFFKTIEAREAKGEEAMLTEVVAGAYLFRISDARALIELLPVHKNGEKYITELLNVLREKGKKVIATISREPMEAMGINRRQDIIAVSNFLRLQKINELLNSGVEIVDPSSTYIEEDVEIGQDTKIMPFVVIENGVKIGRNCVIGPFARLRGNTVIDDECEIGNYVELKSTKMGRHSKSKHLTYLGDAELGKNVNIGAGTITANYDGKNKNKTTIEDGASTGCNTVLVAPVKMGKNSRTGAGTVVPHGKDVPENTTVVGVPARQLSKKNG